MPLSLRVVTPPPTVWRTTVSTVAELTPSGLGDLTHNLVLDSTYNCVRELRDGVLHWFAGLCDKTSGAGDANGNRDEARFNNPQGIARDSSSQNHYIADTGNHCIRKIDQDGWITTVAGVCGEQGFNDGPADVALFSAPVAVSVNATCRLLVSDRSNRRIRQVTLGDQECSQHIHQSHAPTSLSPSRDDDACAYPLNSDAFDGLPATKLCFYLWLFSAFVVGVLVLFMLCFWCRQSERSFHRFRVPNASQEEDDGGLATISTRLRNITTTEWLSDFEKEDNDETQNNIFECVCKKVEADLAESLGADLKHVQRVGSLPKETSIGKHSDVDLVVIFQHFDPSDTPRRLEEIKQALSHNYPVERGTRYCRLKMNEVKVDILVGGPLPLCDDSPRRALVDFLLDLDEEKRLFWGPSLSHQAVTFIQAQQPVVRKAVRATKWWRDNKVRYWEKGTRPASALLELLVVSAYHDIKEGSNPTLPQIVFKTFEQIRNFNTLVVLFRQDTKYDADYARDTFHRGLPPPIVVDPANPTMNVAVKLGDWEGLARQVERHGHYISSPTMPLAGSHAPCETTTTAPAEPSEQPWQRESSMGSQLEQVPASIMPELEEVTTISGGGDDDGGCSECKGE